MTPAEAAVLLAVASAFDGRKPDESIAEAWALALDDYRFEDCRDVIVAHYRATREWLMPSHVIAGVRKVRETRLRQAGDLTPPPELGGKAAETLAWLAEARRRVANGETLPDYPGELRERHLPDLRRVLPAPGDVTTRTGGHREGGSA